MGEIYLYDKSTENYGSIGLVGALCPLSCKHEEQAGGMSELTMEHPVDEWGKWRYLVNDRILKAPVPVRMTPEITDDGRVVTSVEVWTVKDTASKPERWVYSKKSGGKKKKLLATGVSVVVVEKPEDGERYKIKSGTVTGWIASSALEMVIESTIEGDMGGMESLAGGAWTVKDQLFQIYDVAREAGDSVSVTVKARHTTYELLGNVTTYKNDGAVSAKAALTGIRQGCRLPTEIKMYTNVSDERTGVSWVNVNPIEALLGGETGLLERWGLELVRDWDELYFLARAGLNQGVRVEYAKNLTGVKCSDNLDNVYTMILPVGATKDGEDLYLSDDGSDDLVVGSHVADYAGPRIYVLDCKSEATIGEGVSKALARERMRAAAQKLLDDGCDLPEINIEADFVNLGDTEEYARFAGLEKVFLYDTVTVYHPEIGVNVTTDVVRTVWDCLLERYETVELGRLRDVVAGLTSWEIPSGISGGKIRPGTLGGDAFKDDVISARHIQAESIYTDALQARSITAEKIAADALFAQHIVAQIADIVQANINKANIGDATIDYADIVDLKAIFAGIANAQIGDADIDFAKIKDLVAGTAIISQGVGDKLFISRLAVTEANMVSLTTGELIVKGSDGRFYSVGVDAETGEVTTTLKTVEGADIEDGSIDAHEKILERSITADELNVTQIFASEALVGAITAANIAAGQITVNHLSSGVGAALDISSNETIRAMVSKDTVRTMIADSTRELRVRYTGAGTHMVEATDTATLVASVFEGGFDITSTIPETAYIWTRESGDAAADAVWSAAHVGLRTITVTGEDVATRAIISCTLLAIGDVAMTFSIDPDTMLLTATEPAYGVDTATYDAATGCLTIDGEGYAYTAANQAITIDRGGLTASRTTVQYTFSDETQVRSRIQQEHDRIALVVGDGSSSTSLTLTQSFLQAVADNINLQGKVTIGWLSAEAQEQIEEIESDAAAAISAASGALSAASSASSTAGSAWSALVNLCKNNNVTYIDGSKIYTGSIGADQINANSVFVKKMALSANASSYALWTGTGFDLYDRGSYAGSFNFDDNLVNIDGYHDISIRSDNSVRIHGNGAGVELGFVSSDFLPISGNTYALGAASGNRWKRLYTNMQPDVSSDARLKKDIEPLRVGDLIDRLIARQFRMKDDDTKLHFGFIAQEVREALRAVGINDADLLDEENPDSLGLCYSELIAVLVEGWQRHQKEISALKARATAQEERIDRLERLVNELRGVR